MEVLVIHEVQLEGRREHVEHGVVHGMHCFNRLFVVFVYYINGYGHYTTH